MKILPVVKSLLLLTAVSVLSACAPEVGSPDWCKAVETKPKGEMTMNEAKDYAKHCVFK
jgi:hypothetical protein